MWSNRVVVAFSLAFALGACAAPPEPTAGLPDDLKRDLAVASAGGGEFAIAPQAFRPMRFVSDVEQAKASLPVKRPRVSRHAHRPATSPLPADDETSDVAPDPDVVETSESPAPVPSPEAPIPEPTIVVAQLPSTAPASGPAESTSDGSVGDSDRGGGLGGLLGGIIGAVVIRGGHGGRDVCDPRRDGRGPTVVIGRPDFGMPLPTGRSFPGSRRR